MLIHVEDNNMNNRSILVRQNWTLGALAICTLLCGCNPDGPITVTSGYGPGIKFSGLGPKYGWAPEGSERAGPQGLQEVVHASVERNLAAKGFELNPGAPDFWIDYRVTRREKTDASVIAHGETVDEGSLILEVFDPAGRKLVWWGIARAQILDSDTPDVRKRRLESAMKQLMSKFPAKA